MPPQVSLKDTIFWFKALSVCTAIHHAPNVWACDFSPKLNCLLVRMDNMNTVDIFNTLHAKPHYNSILTSSIDTCMRSSLDVQVTHMPGKLNVVGNPTIPRV